MPTPNKTEVHFTDGRVACFSYGVPVCAFIPKGWATENGIAMQGWLRTSERYSVTTFKHVNQWCKDAPAVTDATLRKLIEPVYRTN